MTKIVALYQTFAQLLAKVSTKFLGNQFKNTKTDRSNKSKCLAGVLKTFSNDG